MYNKFMQQDTNGKYTKDKGSWWYHIGVKKKLRYRVHKKQCKKCSIEFLNSNPRGKDKFCSKKCAGNYAYEHSFSPATAKGDKSANWRGGERTTPDGYIEIHMPNHPLLKGTTRKYVRRCRYIVEQNIGRTLEPWEQVHHINCIKDDDRLENLELWATSHPAGRKQYCSRCSCASCIEQRAVL